MTNESLSGFQDPLWGILLRLAIDVAVLYVIIYHIYSRFSKKKDFMFSLFLMGIILFLICILLRKAEMQMGMALGLFAVFSIMRFRTENLVSKNMAYLFTVIGISVINAMFDFPHPLRGTILINIIVILTVFVLEKTFNKYRLEAEVEEERKAEMKAERKAEMRAEKKAEMKAQMKSEVRSEMKTDLKKGKKDEEKKSFSKHQVLYDNLALLNPDKKNELLKDISKRTGIKINKVKIRKIDLINENVVLDVYYKEKGGKAEI
jgi:hypothetical protein